MPTNNLDRYGPGYRWADYNKRRRYTLGRKLAALIGACLLVLALTAIFGPW